MVEVIAKRRPGRPPDPAVVERERQKQRLRQQTLDARERWKEAQIRLRREELEQRAELLDAVRQVASELRAIRLVLVAAAGAAVVDRVNSSSRER